MKQIVIRREVNIARLMTMRVKEKRVAHVGKPLNELKVHKSTETEWRNATGFSLIPLEEF